DDDVDPVVLHVEGLAGALHPVAEDGDDLVAEDRLDLLGRVVGPLDDGLDLVANLDLSHGGKALVDHQCSLINEGSIRGRGALGQGGGSGMSGKSIRPWRSRTTSPRAVGRITTGSADPGRAKVTISCPERASWTRRPDSVRRTRRLPSVLKVALALEIKASR